MRIGVMPVTTGASGGVYQYSRALVEALTVLSRGALREDEFVAVTDAPGSAIVRDLVAGQWPVLDALPRGTFSRVRRWLRRTPLRRPVVAARARWRGNAVASHLDPDVVFKRPRVTQWLESHGVDLMIYCWPTTYAFEVDVPAVVAVHDLQHRLQPQFPEVSARGEASIREHLFRNIARSATLILVDSEVGKDDVLAFYAECGVTAEDVFVLPFVAPPEVRRPVTDEQIADVRRRYSLPDTYAFCPAAFWPHKNHARLFEALAELEDAGEGIHVVLVGSHADEVRQEAYEAAMAVARGRGILHRLHHLGFVPEEDMAPLYRGARALLFPTFFGPTNIPVIEAWSHDVPVLTSDIRGIREQCGDAAVLVDPTSVSSLVEGVRAVWSDEARRDRLIRAGRHRLGLYGVEEHRALVARMLQEAKARVGHRREDGCR